jgi:hypothetical protein
MLKKWQKKTYTQHRECRRIKHTMRKLKQRYNCCSEQQASFRQRQGISGNGIIPLGNGKWSGEFVQVGTLKKLDLPKIYLFFEYCKSILCPP